MKFILLFLMAAIPGGIRGAIAIWGRFRCAEHSYT